jgi:hypothetical protein
MFIVIIGSLDITGDPPVPDKFSSKIANYVSDETCFQIKQLTDDLRPLNFPKFD